MHLKRNLEVSVKTKYIVYKEMGVFIWTCWTMSEQIGNQILFKFSMIILHEFSKIDILVFSALWHQFHKYSLAILWLYYLSIKLFLHYEHIFWKIWIVKKKKS